MALSYKARKRLSLLVLIVGMPLYIVVAVSVVNLFDRPPLLLELAIYAGLGILWVLPLKALFRGVGQPDPDAQSQDFAQVDDMIDDFVLMDRIDEQDEIGDDNR